MSNKFKGGRKIGEDCFQVMMHSTVFSFPLAHFLTFQMEANVIDTHPFYLQCCTQRSDGFQPSLRWSLGIFSYHVWFPHLLMGVTNYLELTEILSSFATLVHHRTAEDWLHAILFHIKWVCPEMGPTSNRSHLSSCGKTRRLKLLPTFAFVNNIKWAQRTIPGFMESFFQRPHCRVVKNESILC